MTTPTDIERLKALTIAIQSYQQADEEGVMVLVSRQACDETAAALRALPSLLARIERVEGEPSAISLLERARDELVECAQDYHHQPKAMIAEINAYLAAAEQSLSSARAEIEGLKTERDEAQMELKRHFPVSKYNGLDIEQWKDRALAAERILALSGQHWRELWYGSEPQKGSWIYADREPVAFIGPDATAHALTTAIVIAHNAAIVSARAEGWKTGVEAAAKVARERVAVLEAFARYAAERFAQIECATLNMMITSPEALSDYRVALASEGALRARHALDEGRAPSVPGAALDQT